MELGTGIETVQDAVEVEIFSSYFIWIYNDIEIQYSIQVFSIVREYEGMFIMV